MITPSILSLSLLSKILPTIAYADTSNPSRKHTSPPQLLCLDSGVCIPKAISTPSLDLEYHVELDISGQASLAPHSGVGMLDRHTVFAVRMSGKGIRDSYDVKERLHDQGGILLRGQFRPIMLRD